MQYDVTIDAILSTILGIKSTNVLTLNQQVLSILEDGQQPHPLP